MEDNIRKILLNQVTTEDDFEGLIIHLESAVKDLTNLINYACNQAREIFVPIRGYEGLYEVSNTGKVRSLPRSTTKGKELMPSKRFRNYLSVTLSNGDRKAHNIHRLVAEAFISNPKNKPTVNHIDGNPLNNSVENLEWATYSEQELHSYTLGKVNANNPSRTALRN